MTVLAHGPPASPGDLWQLEPAATLALLAVGALAGAVVRRRWRRSGSVDRLRLAAAAGGVAVLALAVLSPLHRLADALFAAHMVQHLLLVSVAAPLLVWGAPAVLAAARPTPRSPTWSLPAATAALIATFSLWHAPGLYDAAVRHGAVHAAEHLSMLATALWFWAAAAAVARRGAGMLAVGALAVHGVTGIALGALLTFSPAAWYEGHVPEPWGLDRLTDQQLGGLLMWVVGGALELAVVVALVVAALGGDDEEPVRAPRPVVPAR